MAKLRKQISYYLTYKLIAYIGFFARRLPASTALLLGEHLGDALYHLVKRRRVITMSNLQLAFGSEKSKRELKRIARMSYRNLGKNFIEILAASIE